MFQIAYFVFQAIQDKEQHSISFTMSRSQAIIVEYQRDEETDMFQVLFVYYCLKS